MIENKGLVARQALTVEKSKEVEASIRRARRKPTRNRQPFYLLCHRKRNS